MFIKLKGVTINTDNITHYQEVDGYDRRDNPTKYLEIYFNTKQGHSQSYVSVKVDEMSSNTLDSMLNAQ